MQSDSPALLVGVDARKFPSSTPGSWIATMNEIAAAGLDGVSFRTVFDVSPRLDADVLRDCRQAADDLGLYLEVGIGHLNPFNSAADDTVRRAGEGDFLAGARRVIEETAEIGCSDLWTSLASYQDSSWGIHAIDRFRTDVAWTEQLEYTARVIESLADALRANRSRLSVETHEEVTSGEVAWMAERVGSDILSVTLDPANSVVRGELPVAAARRLTGLVNRTHFRDVVLHRRDDLLIRSLTACGDGRIDWVEMLRAIAVPGVAPRLTIENATDTGVEAIPVDDPRWRALCDVDDVELDALRGWADSEDRATAARPLDRDEQLDFIQRSAACLRAAWTTLQSPE